MASQFEEEYIWTDRTLSSIPCQPKCTQYWSGQYFKYCQLAIAKEHSWPTKLHGNGQLS